MKSLRNDDHDVQRRDGSRDRRSAVPHRVGLVGSCGDPMACLIFPRSHAGEPHYHPYYELVIVQSGHGTLVTAGRTFEVGPGDAVLIPPAAIHAHARLSSCVAWSVRLRPEDVDLVLPIAGASACRFALGEREAVCSILSAIASNRLKPGAILRLQLTAIVALFLGSPAAPRVCVGNAVIRQALAIIDRDFAIMEGPADVALASGKSLGYLSDLVAAETGQPVVAWLRERRLFAANVLLATGKACVFDVAYAVGFADPGHFARLFRRRFGVAPSAWREHLATGAFVAATGDAR